mgnify:CR=1 FL=1
MSVRLSPPMTKIPGGSATALRLPALGVVGNSHAMMSDENNLEVAALVEEWIRRVV